tara:strand:+ start:293 stop:715 length:423 start_codon:yes stop_codon:yes gene_type:complete
MDQIVYWFLAGLGLATFGAFAISSHALLKRTPDSLDALQEVILGPDKDGEGGLTRAIALQEEVIDNLLGRFLLHIDDEKKVLDGIGTDLVMLKQSTNRLIDIHEKPERFGIGTEATNEKLDDIHEMLVAIGIKQDIKLDR